MARTIVFASSRPGLGLVSDLCHPYPGKGISEDFKEQKWLKISPSKNVS
jgi:hypothetical protein